MITELYVPRSRLADFLGAAADGLRRRRAQVVYGTVRLVERDDDSLLAWAREPWACVVFNLHVRHDAAGLAAAADSFRALIDLALARGGSYRSEEHTSELQSLMRISYAVFCLKKKKNTNENDKPPTRRKRQTIHTHYNYCIAQ